MIGIHRDFFIKDRLPGIKNGERIRRVENFIKPLRERRGAADAKGLFRRRVVFDDVEILVDNDRDIRRFRKDNIGKGFRALTHERHAHRQLRLTLIDGDRLIAQVA